jgi:hypothetical protein
VDWIFQEKISLYDKRDSKDTYRTGLAFYKRFLQETNNYNPLLDGDPRFYIKDEWDVMALHKVKQWIEATNIPGTEDYLASYTVLNNFGAIRQTMEYAYEHNYIKRPVIYVRLPPGVRETSLRTAYSNEEYTAIFNTISPMIQFSRSLLRPYRKTGKGCDPKRVEKRGAGRGEKLLGQGWTCWAKTLDGNHLVRSDDNLRWYFENVMDCVPLPGTPEHMKKHQPFFASASSIHGGLNRLYRKWGVASLIDQDVIMPLVVKLTLRQDSMLSRCYR